MGNKQLADLIDLKLDELKKVLGEQVEGKHNTDILFFNYNSRTSFLYPSPLWISALRDEVDDESEYIENTD